MRRLIVLLALTSCAAPTIRNVRQLTFDGTHAEAYFSPDGRKLILQAQRPGDKADQIYILDLATHDLRRATDGRGKAT